MVSLASLNALSSYGSIFLKEHRFDEAEGFYKTLLSVSDTYAPAYLGLYMAQNAITDEDSLLAHLSVSGQGILMESDLLLSALKFADPDLTVKLKDAVNGAAPTINNGENDASRAVAAIRNEINYIYSEIDALKAKSKDRAYARRDRSAYKEQAAALTANLPKIFANLEAALHDAIVTRRADMLNQGDFFLYGAYQQSDKPAAPAPVRWKVVAKDEHYAFAVCESILDVMPIHTENVPCTWQSSYLKQWLNNEFMNTALSVAEKSRLFDKNSLGKVFIPSVNEFKANIYDRRVTPHTAYSETKKNYDDTCYWLRHDDITPAGAFPYVHKDNVSEDAAHVFRRKYGVRPAIYIRLH